MSSIFFFCIPAHGHTNPTLPVVRELTSRGHQVRYYSFDEFRDKITDAGAEFISCDRYLPQLDQRGAERLMKVSASEMTVIDLKTTVRLDPLLNHDVEKYRPDCIVSDSVCFWGKLIAQKHAIAFVCSTTTFAFNRCSSRYIKNSPKEIADILLGMPRIHLVSGV